MPDPRQPQRPQPPPPQRQPAMQAQRGQPMPRPGPHDPKPGQGGSRPIRMLDPSEQAPPVETERKIRKGETYWVMGHEHLPRPLKGKIVRLTSDPSRAVGVEFNELMGGTDDNGQSWGVVHTCDGHGRLGYCLYVRPDQVLDEKTMASVRARQTTRQAAPTCEEYEEITVGPQHSQPQTPASAPPADQSDDQSAESREKMTIESKDAGTLSAESLFGTKPKAKDEDEDKDEDDDE